MTVCGGCGSGLRAGDLGDGICWRCLTLVDLPLTIRPDESTAPPAGSPQSQPVTIEPVRPQTTPTKRQQSVPRQAKAQQRRPPAMPVLEPPKVGERQCDFCPRSFRPRRTNQRYCSMDCSEAAKVERRVG